MERQIAFERTVGVEFDAAATILRTQMEDLICDDPVARTFTVHAELAGFDVARMVVVGLGVPRDIDAHSVVVPLSWQAEDRPNAFPTVDGILELSAMSHAPPVCQLGFFGDVEVPMGLLGSIGDALGGRKVADRVLERVVDRVAARLAIAVAQQAAEAASRLTPQHASRAAVVLPQE